MILLVLLYPFFLLFFLLSDLFQLFIVALFQPPVVDPVEFLKIVSILLVPSHSSLTKLFRSVLLFQSGKVITVETRFSTQVVAECLEFYLVLDELWCHTATVCRFVCEVGIGPSSGEPCSVALCPGNVDFIC